MKYSEVEDKKIEKIVSDKIQDTYGIKPFNPYKLFNGIFIPDCLLSYKKLSMGAKLCYGRIIKYCGKNGYCYPKQETVAKELGISRSQVTRYLKELTKEKFI